MTRPSVAPAPAQPAVTPEAGEETVKQEDGVESVSLGIKLRFCKVAHVEVACRRKRPRTPNSDASRRFPRTRDASRYGGQSWSRHARSRNR